MRLVSFIIFMLIFFNFSLVAKEAKSTTPMFGATLGYDITSDYAEEKSPRLYDNRLFTIISLNFLPYNINTKLKGALTFTTLGSSIYEENPDSNGLHAADTTLLFTRSFKIEDKNFQLIGKHQIIPMLFNIIPTSESSRYAGYKSSPGVQAIVHSTFFDGTYTLINGTNFIKVINTYTHNPATHLPSPSTMSVFSQEHSFNLIWGFSIAGGFSFKYAKNVNGDSNTTFENSASLDFTYGAFHSSLAYSGGDHTTNDKVELWYVDNTRRLITLTVELTF